MVRTNFNETEWAHTVFRQAMRDPGARNAYTVRRGRELATRLSKAGNKELERMATYIGRTFIGTIYGGRIAIIDFDDLRSATGLPSLVSRTQSAGSRLERRTLNDQRYFRDLYRRLTVTPGRGGREFLTRFPTREGGSSFFQRISAEARGIASPGERARNINIFGHELQSKYDAPVVRWHRLGRRYLEQKRKAIRSPNFFQAFSLGRLKLKTYFLNFAGRRIVRATGGIRIRLRVRRRAESPFYQFGRGGNAPLRSVLGELRVAFLPRIPISIKTSLLRGVSDLGNQFEYQVFPQTIAKKLVNDSFEDNEKRPLVQPILGWWLVNRVPYILQQAVIRSSRRAERRVV